MYFSSTAINTYYKFILFGHELTVGFVIFVTHKIFYLKGDAENPAYKL